MSEVVWRGPLADGITQSLLSKYIVCKERFRLLVIDGMKEEREFDHKLEYGNMWHVCEEALGQGLDWKIPLRNYCRAIGAEHPTASEEITKWYRVCCIQFPIYVNFWKSHKDVKARKAIFHEEVINHIYTLPSGRTILIRGKVDGYDSINRKEYLQENKIKGNVNEEQICEELPSNLQTMMYLSVLRQMGYHPKGVRYNVIRRPFGDWRGKYNIHRKKGRKTKKGVIGAETEDQYYQRLGALIQSDCPYFFMRWSLMVTDEDITRFENECLFPILENLVDDYEWWSYCKHCGINPYDYLSRQNTFGWHHNRHFRTPFGIYNPIALGRIGPYANFINNGDTRGMIKVETLFPELASIPANL